MPCQRDLVTIVGHFPAIAPDKRCTSQVTGVSIPDLAGPAIPDRLGPGNETGHALTGLRARRNALSWLGQQTPSARPAGACWIGSGRRHWLSDSGWWQHGD